MAAAIPVWPDRMAVEIADLLAASADASKQKGSKWKAAGDRQLTTTAMSLTPSLPSSFQLASDEVHSWCASLDVPPETSARLYATLTPDERTRSARFRFARDQQRFIVARGVLRDLLGRYLQTQPSQIGFVYNAFGSVSEIKKVEEGEKHPER